MLNFFLNYDKGSISDLVKKSLNNPIKKYDVIYIDLWFDAHTLISSFNGMKDCKHKSVDENNRCSCGAWVGNILTESSPMDFYHHIFNIVNNINANEVYIRSPMYYPPNYRYSIFSKEIHLNFPFAETYHIYDKTVSFSERENDEKQKNFFLLHFSKRKSKLWKSKVLKYKGFNPLYLLNTNSLWVNPYYNEVKTDIEIDYFICNTNVLKTLEN